MVGVVAHETIIQIYKRTSKDYFENYGRFSKLCLNICLALFTIALIPIGIVKNLFKAATDILEYEQDIFENLIDRTISGDSFNQEHFSGPKKFPVKLKFENKWLDKFFGSDLFIKMIGADVVDIRKSRYFDVYQCFIKFDFKNNHPAANDPFAASAPPARRSAGRSRTNAASAAAHTPLPPPLCSSSYQQDGQYDYSDHSDDDYGWGAVSEESSDGHAAVILPPRKRSGAIVEERKDQQSVNGRQSDDNDDDWGWGAVSEESSDGHAAMILPPRKYTSATIEEKNNQQSVNGRHL